MTPKEIRALLELMQAYHLAELEIERSGVRIRLKRETAHAAAPVVSAPASLPAVPHTGEAEKRPADSFVAIEAPMVGTFYRAPAPDAPPYVKEGDLIKEGQILCIIEAMKLMNELESKVAGRVVKVLVENGQGVEYGQPLFLVEPVA